MTDGDFDKINLLLCKINKVTAPHRHGNKIPKRDLDALSNFQIEFEAWLKNKKGSKFILRKGNSSLLSLKDKESFLKYISDLEINKLTRIRLNRNSVLFEGPECSFSLHNEAELDECIKQFTLDVKEG